MSADTLYKAYQELPEGEKHQFLALLLDVVDEELLPEWQKEIQRRWENFENDPSAALDGSEVEKQLAAKHGL